MSDEAQSVLLVVLHDRLNTRGLLRRKHMQLDSYTCEMCLLQRVESVRHLFLRYSFAKKYWFRIGVQVPTWLKPNRATRHIKRSLRMQFAMDIIILMTWCIWKERNGWLFTREDTSVDRCLVHFKREFALVIHRAKSSRSQIWNHGFAI
jgi:hypothetical protein